MYVSDISFRQGRRKLHAKLFPSTQSQLCPIRRLSGSVGRSDVGLQLRKNDAPAAAAVTTLGKEQQVLIPSMSWRYFGWKCRILGIFRVMWKFDDNPVPNYPLDIIHIYSIFLLYVSLVSKSIRC